MGKMIDVNTGEVRVGQARSVLRANAIGSCIVIAAFDVRIRCAAMAHVMLPGQAPKKETCKTKYAVDAIDTLLDRMRRIGSSPADIQVCLIGAGNVLRRDDDTICEKNRVSVTTLLTRKRIPVRASCLGGYERKSALLDVASAMLFYTEGDRPRAVLYRFWGPGAPGRGYLAVAE